MSLAFARAGILFSILWLIQAILSLSIPDAPAWEGSMYEDVFVITIQALGLSVPFFFVQLWRHALKEQAHKNQERFYARLDREREEREENRRDRLERITTAEAAGKT